MRDPKDASQDLVFPNNMSVRRMVSFQCVLKPIDVRLDISQLTENHRCHIMFPKITSSDEKKHTLTLKQVMISKSWSLTNLSLFFEYWPLNFLDVIDI